jgi:hypothetical protein
MRRRISFAAVVAVVAGVFAATRYSMSPGPSDFAPVWYGASALLDRLNPYSTFGPGAEFHYAWYLYYPPTAMVAALPFGLLSEPRAAVLFASISAGLLAFGITRDNWDRWWIFLSASFLTAARSAQWSPLMAAAWLIPALGFIVVCKPNLGAAIAVSTPSSKSLRVALIGGTLLTVIAFALLPTWPAQWWRAVMTGKELNAPITRLPGFLIALALLRWRQPEARLLFALACVPQTSSWYETLMPLLVARTKREMQVLGLASGVGYIAQIAFLSENREIATTDIGVLIVVFVYLPALAIVLRRPNEGQLPAWMLILKRSVSATSRRDVRGNR